MDDEFQKSVQSVFNVNKMSKIGSISADDEKSESVQCEYRRGPVKLLKRARSKAQNEYYEMPYPTSAAVLDLNRCSLVFGDINSLLVALDFFVNKVYSYSAGSIIGVVRSKNGFAAYNKEGPQYADIKLNVLIRGGNTTNYNLIGEVQFLLSTMTAYKMRAHNLYSIERERNFVDVSVTEYLPALIDKEQQLKVYAASGDTKGLCSLLVHGNKSPKDIFAVQNEPILIPLSKRGSIKAFKIVLYLMREQKISVVDQLFEEDDYENTAIEWAVRNGRLNLLKHILSLDGVQEKCKLDKFCYRLIYYALIWCANAQIIEFLMECLKVSNGKMIEFLTTYEHPDTYSRFRRNKIILNVIKCNSTRMLKKINSILGDKIFVDVLIEAGAVAHAIDRNSFSHFKYLMSLPMVAARYEGKDENEETQKAMYRLLYFVFVRADDKLKDAVLSYFNFDDDTIAKMLKYKYPKEEIRDAFHGIEFHNWPIVGRVIFENTLDRLKEIARYYSEKQFVDHVVVPNGDNVNGVEYAIRKKKIDILEHLFSFNEIKSEYLSDKELIWRCVCWMNEAYDESVAGYLVKELSLNQEKLKEIQAFKCPKPVDVVK